MEVIQVRAVECFGRHGAYDIERASDQKFEVDLELHCDLSKARDSDLLADTIDYSRAIAIARQVIEGPSRNLLERLADEIAKQIWADLRPRKVVVTVRKLTLPGSCPSTSGAQVTVAVGD